MYLIIKVGDIRSTLHFQKKYNRQELLNGRRKETEVTKKERSRQTFNINFYDLCTNQHNLSYSPALLYFSWVRVAHTHAHVYTHTHTTQSSDLTVSYSMNVKSTEFICTFLAGG